MLGYFRPLWLSCRKVEHDKIEMWEKKMITATFKWNLGWKNAERSHNNDLKESFNLDIIVSQYMIDFLVSYKQADV